MKSILRTSLLCGRCNNMYVFAVTRPPHESLEVSGSIHLGENIVLSTSKAERCMFTEGCVVLTRFIRSRRRLIQYTLPKLLDSLRGGGAGTGGLNFRLKYLFQNFRFFKRSIEIEVLLLILFEDVDFLADRKGEEEEEEEEVADDDIATKECFVTGSSCRICVNTSRLTRNRSLRLSVKGLNATSLSGSISEIISFVKPRN